jgi:hypothetical protein
MITDNDRRLAARARELAAINRIDALRERYGTSSTEAALTDQWGESAHLLAELAAIVNRLDGRDAAQITEESHG